MTRAEETARVHELRAAFAASEEPDVFRWFARLEAETRGHFWQNLAEARLWTLEHERKEIKRLNAIIAANPQSAAEPPRDRTDFAWDVIGETESF